MASQKPEEVHVTHCMVFEFKKGSSYYHYSNALHVCKCKRCVSKLRYENLDLSNAHRLGRATTLDNGFLRAVV